MPLVVLWLICCNQKSMREPLHLERGWTEVKEQLKELNTGLTDEDLDYDHSSPEALLMHLSRKLNKNEKEIREWIESVSTNKGKAG